MTFAVMVLAAAVGLGEFSSGVKADIEKRISRELVRGDRVSEVTGTVTYSDELRFFVQDGCESLKMVLDRGVVPKCGETVTVSGYPSLEGGRVVMVVKSWKSVGHAELPEPLTPSPSDLTENGGRGVNWMRVRLEGRAFEATENGFAMDVDGIPVTVAVNDAPFYIRECGSLRPKVMVTGVVELILDQGVLFGRDEYVMGVKLSAVSAADIELEPDLVYLMNMKDLKVRIAVYATVGLLAVGLLVFLVIIFRQRRRHFRTATLMAERKRMADDIHDTIEQHLVGAGMLIQIGRNKEARDVLVRAKAELRDIIWGLKNDDMMRLSPAEMLRQTAELETKKGIFRVSTKIVGLPDRMSAQEMRDLSLIVREAIGNAVKHGGAKKIAITCDARPGGGWMLRIANDGAPFDPAKAPGAAEGHFGLEGMRERAKRLGASVEISTDNLWTVISVIKNEK